MIFLENEHIRASFATKGAELQSFKSKPTNQEYLWNGNPGYWGKFSPVLFPIVGGLKNNTYYYEDREYQLSRHGFARDKYFDPQQISETEVIFTLKYNQETLKVYPFKFILSLHYKLSEASLTCTYKISNPGDSPLLFSIGGHPAFSTMTSNDINYTDYHLKFNKDSELVYHKIKNDLIDDETVTIVLKEGILPLKHELFYGDALVFKTLKSDCISLQNSQNTHGLHFRFSNFPYFGIWAAKDADFICLEPWCGIADGINHNQNLEDKEGIITLKPNEIFEHCWSVECF